ncbi:hypothetical protein Vadar_006862 [Vaccinium darrowii]|uniref:Uncharacterized protein n=1 Tax=Vaccinium darrowii TaxID=229202 RepID=A0ACB7X8P1_9ERIC|nr:hypothetical protein Vadar_006862 [Vaccinium darrowii]
MAFGLSASSYLAPAALPTTEMDYPLFLSGRPKSGLRFELFSFLCPKLVTKIDDELVEDDEEEEEVDADYLVEHTHYEFYGPVGYAASLHHLMLLLIARHPNIQSVEITDSKRHGGLKLDGEELIRIWYVSRMELSGFVMKKVTLVVFRGNGVVANASGCGGGGGVGEVEDNGDALDGGFEGDGEGIFGEAMKEILTKHRFKARCYPIPQDEADW